MSDCIKTVFIWFVVSGLLFSRLCYSEEYIFSAPPTDDRKISIAIYSPVAEYLSMITGEKFVYKHPKNWPDYLSTMQKGGYDVLIDSPHFISWRMENIGHRPIVAIARSMSYVVVHLSSVSMRMEDLKGKPVCSSALPNMEALTLTDQYDSISSQPLIKVTRGYKNMLYRLKSQECEAAIIPKRVFDRYLKNSPDSDFTVLFESSELPHLGFSAGSALSREMQKKIGFALVSERPSEVLSGLKNKYALALSDDPVLADAEMYSGYAYLLEDFWGF